MDEDSATLQFGKEFNDAQALLISEVRVLLEANQDKRRSNNEEQKTIDYCARFSKFTDKQTLKEIRQLFPITDYHQFEACQIVNLGCETVEEAKTLIPSLNSRSDDVEMQDLLDQMSNLRKFQSMGYALSIITLHDTTPILTKTSMCLLTNKKLSPRNLKISSHSDSISTIIKTSVSDQCSALKSLQISFILPLQTKYLLQPLQMLIDDIPTTLIDLSLHNTSLKISQCHEKFKPKPKYIHQQSPDSIPDYWSIDQSLRNVYVAEYHTKSLTVPFQKIVGHMPAHVEVHIGNTAWSMFAYYDSKGNADYQGFQSRPVTQSHKVYGMKWRQNNFICKSNVSDVEIRRHVYDLWRGRFHSLKRNCYHFADFVLEFICGTRLPKLFCFDFRSYFAKVDATRSAFGALNGLKGISGQQRFYDLKMNKKNVPNLSDSEAWPWSDRRRLN